MSGLFNFTPNKTKPSEEGLNIDLPMAEDNERLRFENSHNAPPGKKGTVVKRYLKSLLLKK